jgi:hypothetical protein
MKLGSSIAKYILEHVAIAHSASAQCQSSRVVTFNLLQRQHQKKFRTGYDVALKWSNSLSNAWRSAKQKDYTFQPASSINLSTPRHRWPAFLQRTNSWHMTQPDCTSRKIAPHNSDCKLIVLRHEQLISAPKGSFRTQFRVIPFLPRMSLKCRKHNAASPVSTVPLSPILPDLYSESIGKHGSYQMP